MDIVIKLAQLILSLSILVILHELGHFIPAKLFKTRVEKFYLFFDPWFSLFKFKKGDTEYGIGWLPLGGYVKIAGMVDESMDKSYQSKEAQPWEFRSKPAWQRLIIMIGGVTINFLLGFLIFGCMLMYYGESYLPTDQMKYGMAVDSLGQSLGFVNGDKIISIDGKPVTEFEPGKMVKSIMLDDAKEITIERNGSNIALPVTDGMRHTIEDNQRASMAMLTPRIPVTVAKLSDGMPAKQAGIQPEDQIVKIDTIAVNYFDQMVVALKQFKGKNIPITVMRGGKELTIDNVGVTKEGQIGIFPYSFDKYFKIDKRHFSFGQAMPAGFHKGVDLISAQLSGFKKMITGEIDASKSLGGFISIFNMYSPTWDWEVFWNFTAILSLILGFMNLLPIPALDGGYIMFLLWEMITGKKVNDRVMEIATTVGLVLLMGLMLYANGLDIVKLWK